MTHKKKMDTLPCIVCTKTLGDVGSGVVNHPSKAVVFTAPGQYGSTVFDPMDGSCLEINVCDECLMIATKEHRVLLNEPKSVVSARKAKVVYWKGEG